METECFAMVYKKNNNICGRDMIIFEKYIRKMPDYEVRGNFNTCW